MLTSVIFDCAAFHKDTTFRSHITRSGARSLLISIVILNSVTNWADGTIAFFWFLRISRVPDLDLVDISSGPASSVESVLKVDTIVAKMERKDKLAN